MRQVAVAGCVEGFRGPNVARYAARAEESGSSPEHAKAEAEYAMGKLQPLFEDACRCVLADILSGKAMAMTKEELAASTKQRAADCLPSMVEAIDSRLDKADIEAFRTRLRAGHVRP